MKIVIAIWFAGWAVTGIIWVFLEIGGYQRNPCWHSFDSQQQIVGFSLHCLSRIILLLGVWPLIVGYGGWLSLMASGRR